MTLIDFAESNRGKFVMTFGSVRAYATHKVKEYDLVCWLYTLSIWSSKGQSLNGIIVAFELLQIKLFLHAGNNNSGLKPQEQTQLLHETQLGC